MASAGPDQNIAAVATPACGLEVVPIPMAHVVRQAGALAFTATNAAFDQAGLGIQRGPSPMLSALNGRIDAFLDGSAHRDDFAWSFGSVIDCRHYQVTLVRLDCEVADRCALTFVDQTSQVQTERSLRREMTTDSLTGLLNRVGFAEAVERTQDAEARHAVLVVDLNRFGRFNACLGSLAGDELLITVARRLKSALRARDTLARIDGDEFAILMAIDQDAGEGLALARRLEQSLHAPFRLASYEIGVTCSIGIAFDTDAHGHAEELIRHAQFAVKRAKVSGQPELYQTQAFAIARAQFGMETELRRAIEERSLALAYQPIWDLATDRIVAFEALARWPGQDHALRSPNSFIPVAEESGLIVPLGRWAIDEAARTLSIWDLAAGGDCGVRIAVNLSAIQLQRDSVANVLERALTQYGLAGDRFTLELTESAIVTDPDGITETLEALKALGTTLALDDFGTGYSNLAYLQKLPIDILKIDRSFVTGMLSDRDAVAIVRAVLSLAQALGMKTTAEGIETPELAQTLAALGCSYGQGYLRAPPLEAETAYELLNPRALAA